MKKLNVQFSAQELSNAFAAAGMAATPQQVQIFGSSLFEKLDGLFGFGIDAGELVAAQTELALQGVAPIKAVPTKSKLELMQDRVSAYLTKYPITGTASRRFAKNRTAKKQHIATFLNSRTGSRTLSGVAASLTVTNDTALGLLAEMIGQGQVVLSVGNGRSGPTFSLTAQGLTLLEN
jgi:hypothetical protein